MSEPAATTPTAPPKRNVWKLLLVVVLVGIAAYILLPKRHGGGFGDGARSYSANNLRTIGLGLQNYASAQERYPANAICAPDGTPLLSWRVAILPYIEQDILYDQFKLDEPWDSPANKPLIARMPKVFMNPRGGKDGLTPYRAFVGKRTAFESVYEDVGVVQNRWNYESLARCPRGAKNVAHVIEADDPVIWTKPEDIPFDPEKPLPALKPIWNTGFLVLKADGSVISIRSDEIEQLRNSIDPNGTSKEPLGD